MTLCFFYSRNLKKVDERGGNELFGRVVTVVERAIIY